MAWEVLRRCLLSHGLAVTVFAAWKSCTHPDVCKYNSCSFNYKPKAISERTLKCKWSLFHKKSYAVRVLILIMLQLPCRQVLKVASIRPWCGCRTSKSNSAKKDGRCRISCGGTNSMCGRYRMCDTIHERKYSPAQCTPRILT